NRFAPLDTPDEVWHQGLRFGVADVIEYEIPDEVGMRPTRHRKRNWEKCTSVTLDDYWTPERQAEREADGIHARADDTALARHIVFPAQVDFTQTFRNSDGTMRKVYTVVNDTEAPLLTQSIDAVTEVIDTAVPSSPKSATSKADLVTWIIDTGSGKDLI